MHRAYTTILPTTNKYLQQQWDTTYYNEHRKKVKDAAPMVDTKAPPTYMHLHLKLKKLQLEEERLATIERDNRILLEKMSFIMRTRGRVDNRNNYEYKSLNREKRQRELLRVTEENRSILRRITLRGAEYSAEQLHRDWEENQMFMDSISRFPKDWWKKGEKEPETSRQNSARTPKKQTKDDNISTKDDDKNKDDTTKDDKKDDTTKDDTTKDNTTKDNTTKDDKKGTKTKGTKDSKESKSKSKDKTRARSPAKGSKSPAKGSKSPSKGAKGIGEDEGKKETKNDDDTKETETKDEVDTKKEESQEEEKDAGTKKEVDA